MKLYATVTSERASKGQGGNKYIKIELSNEDECFGFIDISPNQEVTLNIHGTELRIPRGN